MFKLYSLIVKGVLQLNTHCRRTNHHFCCVFHPQTSWAGRTWGRLVTLRKWSSVWMMNFEKPRSEQTLRSTNTWSYKVTFKTFIKNTPFSPLELLTNTWNVFCRCPGGREKRKETTGRWICKTDKTSSRYISALFADIPSWRLREPGGWIFFLLPLSK